MEYDNIQARSLIKKLMHEYELTNKECAIMLGISDSSFRNKLSRGTFKLSEYTKLLKCLNVKVVYLDKN